MAADSLIATTDTPLNIGQHVLISDNGEYMYISCKKVSNTNTDGDVFIYKYDKINKSWSYETNLHSLVTTFMSNHESNSGVNPAYFGDTVRASNDGKIVFVGIPGYRTTSISKGAVCIFQNNSNIWTLKQSISGPVSANNYFGSSIASSNDGNVLFVGTNANTYNISNVFKYDYDTVSGTYSQNTSFSIKPENSIANSNFGTSIDCNNNGDILVVGSDYYGYNVDGNNKYTGTVQVFKNTNGTW